jgi:hypothetical protein
VALVVEETTRVGAPPEAVWRLLTELPTWRFWWPSCRHAEASDRRPLHDGSSFEYVLEGRLVPVTHRATVDVAQPGKALLWIDRALGVERRHAFYVEPGGWGTLVRERATFEGWNGLAARLLGRAPATSLLFRENLKGLRKAAERSR